MNKKTERISARITKADKQKFKQTGLTIEQAIDYFITLVNSTEDNLTIENNIITEKIKKKKLDVLALEMELERNNNLLKEIT